MLCWASIIYLLPTIAVGSSNTQPISEGGGELSLLYRLLLLLLSSCMSYVLLWFVVHLSFCNQTTSAQLYIYVVYNHKPIFVCTHAQLHVLRVKDTHTHTTILQRVVVWTAATQRSLEAFALSTVRCWKRERVSLRKMQRMEEEKKLYYPIQSLLHW